MSTSRLVTSDHLHASTLPIQGYLETHCAHDYPINALIMACMRQADTAYMNELVEAFPLIYAELEARYNTPGGLLSDERLRGCASTQGDL